MIVASRLSASVPVTGIDVSAYRIPTATAEESDGTATWNATTLVLVEAEAGGKHGLGYTYADTATATMIRISLPQSFAATTRWRSGRFGRRS
jgi:hypothetical protein